MHQSPILINANTLVFVVVHHTKRLTRSLHKPHVGHSLREGHAPRNQRARLQNTLQKDSKSARSECIT